MLLDAAFELLGTEGWSATTVRSVCHAAQLNYRYFYESFSDLDELIVALYDRLVGELGEAAVAAIAAAGDQPGARLRAAIDCIVSFVADDVRRARVLYVEALGNEALNRRRIETGHAVVALVEAHGAKPGEPRHPIARVAAAILVGGLSELIVAWLDGRIETSREQLVDDATTLFLGLGDTARRIART